jgi:hypothetical protein
MVCDGVQRERESERERELLKEAEVPETWHDVT